MLIKLRYRSLNETAEADSAVSMTPRKQDSVVSIRPRKRIQRSRDHGSLNGPVEACAKTVLALSSFLRDTIAKINKYVNITYR
jgi:hypothetical protein